MGRKHFLKGKTDLEKALFLDIFKGLNFRENHS